ncbi:MAG: hypothetical protein C4346_08220 [Chloroflexota bacterium]
MVLAARNALRAESRALVLRAALLPSTAKHALAGRRRIVTVRTAQRGSGAAQAAEACDRAAA